MDVLKSIITGFTCVNHYTSSQCFLLLRGWSFVSASLEMVNVAVNIKMCVNVSPDDFSEGECIEFFCTVLSVTGPFFTLVLFVHQYW